VGRRVFHYDTLIIAIGSHGNDFGSQRLTGALLDRLTHHVHILELNGESYRLKQSKANRRRDPRPADEAAATANPETGEITPAS
jgi:IstB-like ATP binding protein